MMSDSGNWTAIAQVFHVLSTVLALSCAIFAWRQARTASKTARSLVLTLRDATELHVRLSSHDDAIRKLTTIAKRVESREVMAERRAGSKEREPDPQSDPLAYKRFWRQKLGLLGSARANHHNSADTSAG